MLSLSHRLTALPFRSEMKWFPELGVERNDSALSIEVEKETEMWAIPNVMAALPNIRYDGSILTSIIMPPNGRPRSKPDSKQPDIAEQPKAK